VPSIASPMSVADAFSRKRVSPDETGKNKGNAPVRAVRPLIMTSDRRAGVEEVECR